MDEFLLTGRIGGLRVGMPSSATLTLLGPPENLGKGIGEARIETYCGRSFQISHHSGVIVLIAIYFSHRLGEALKLPSSLRCELPFSGLTTVREFEVYLENHHIPWSRNEISPDSDQLNLAVGENVVAVFRGGCLSSLQSSAR
jgi:hypothetical protein